MPSADFRIKNPKQPITIRKSRSFCYNTANSWRNAMFSKTKSRLPRKQDITNFAINFTQNLIDNHGISRIRKRNAINVREFSGPTIEFRQKLL